MIVKKLESIYQFSVKSNEFRRIKKCPLTFMALNSQAIHTFLDYSLILNINAC